MPDIRIDTTGLAITTFQITPGTQPVMDGNHGATVSVPAAGQYEFRQPIGFDASFPFTVADDGTVHVDSPYAGFVHGDGTTLTITGIPVTIDGRTLAQDLDPHSWYVAADGTTTLSRASTHQINLLPLHSGSYQFYSPAGAWTEFGFNLTPDGQLIITPQPVQGVSVSGTTLTITGIPVTIDGRTLAQDLDPHSWYVAPDGTTTLSRASTHQINLLPLQTPVYEFYSPAGAWTAFAFNLTADGQLVVNPQPVPGVSVSGTTLTITGIPVTIDGRTLPQDLALDGFAGTVGVLTRDHTHTVALLALAGPYRLLAQPQPGPAYRFIVHVDGTIVLLDAGPLVYSSAAAVPSPSSGVSQLRRAVDTAEIELDRYDALANTTSALAAEFGPPRDGARQRLAAARSALHDAVNQQPPIWADSAPVPALLVPVRLEVRYWPNEQQPNADPALAIRVIPDDIAVHTFEPELTDTERNAATAYWTAVSAAGATDADRTAAWNRILGQLGAARAAWAVEVMHPTTDAPAPVFPDVPGRASTWTRAATSLLLPDRFVFRGWRGGNLAFEVTGSDVPKDLALGPDPAELSGSQPPPLGWSTASAWMVNFSEAVRVGMGVVVPLTGTDVTFDEIMVLGTSDRSPQTATADLATSLQGHLYTRGLAFPPVDAPTNNTPATRSEWTSAPAMRTPEEVAAAIAAQQPGSGQPAVVLADALGFGPAGAAAVPGRRDLVAARGGTDRDDDAPARHANDVLRILYTTFQGLLDAGGPTVGWLSSTQAADHFVNLIRARGPLPTLRVGRQPYGVLPVTSLALWADSGSTELPGDLITRLRLLHGLIGRYLPMSPRVGRGRDQDDVLLGLLRRVSDPVGVRFGEVSTNFAPFEPNLLKDAFTKLYWRIDGFIALAGRGQKSLVPNNDIASSSLKFLSDVEAAQATRTSLNSPDPPAPPLPGWIAWVQNLTDQQRGAIGLSWTLALNVAGIAVYYGAIALKEIRDIELTPNPAPADLANLTKFRGLVADLRTLLTTMATLESPATADQGALDRQLAGAIEALTCRVDSWFTSLGTARLNTTRAAAPTGVRLGAYGWLVDVEPTAPAARTAETGWVLTPSMQHAATAAVLHSGWAAHSHPQAFAVDLTSDRVRSAQLTLEALREGRNLEELLGYQLERALHDAQADDLIAPLRYKFPLPVADPALSNAAAAAADHGKRLVVDGQAARHGGAGFIADARALPVTNGAITLPPGVTVNVTHLDVLAPLLSQLDDTIDATGDVLLAESVHHLVSGSPLRAGLTADTVGKANPAPERLDVISTPRSHVTVTHAAALAVAVPKTASWASPPPPTRASLDPVAETVAAWALGPASGWTVTITPAGAPPDVSTLADLTAGAIDVIAEATAPIDSSALAARIRHARGVDGPVTVARADGLGGGDALPVLAETIRALLVAARPTTSPTAALTPLAAGQLADLTELAGRVNAWWSAVTAALAAWPAGSPAQQASAMTTLATLGLAGARFDTSPELGAALAQRWAATTLPPTPPPDHDPDATAWLNTVRDAVAAAAGGWFLAAPLWAASQDDWSALGGAEPPGAPVAADDVEDWLADQRDVRAGVTRLLDAVSASGAVGEAPLSWIVRQDQLSSTGQQLIGWVAREHPGARSATNLAAMQIGTPNGTPRALLIVDQWVEAVPATPPGDAVVPDHTAGLGFRFDRPEARAPQAVLLVAPPDLQRGWCLEDLHAAVEETLWWAKARPLDCDDLPELRWVLG